MAWSFNPFTGNLDLVGAGGTVVFEGEVATFADLPVAVGDPAVGASYLVRESTGVWLVNRKQAGIWIRKNNTGVRATDWEYGGDYPVNSVNGQTGNVSLTASDVGAVPTSRTISAGTGLTGGGNLTADRTLAVSYGTTSGTACQGNDSRLSDSRTPTAHSSSHSTSGSDPISPSSIGAQSLFTSTSVVWTSNGNDQTLTAGRAVVVTANNYFAASVNLTLPTTGNLAGDVFVVKTTASPSGNIVIRRLQFGSVFQTLATITANGQSYRFIAASGTGSDTWQIDPVYTHTHAASEITSGVLDNNRVNFAAPAAIGSTTPNTVAATDLSASNKLSLPSAAAASPTAGDIYRNANTLRYRDSTNTERLLLNASDNLANLASASAARTNLGVGSSDAVTFGSIQNTPIGSTTAAAITGTTGTFTTLSANNGTVTADGTPVLAISQTLNNGAVSFDAATFTLTNMASGANSNFFRFIRGTTGMVLLGRDGRVTARDGFAFNPDNFNTRLVEDGSHIIAQRNSTNPQTFRLYNTYTDASNYERGFMRWSSNVLQIGTEAGGTGSNRAIQFWTSGSQRWQIGTGGEISGSSGLGISLSGIGGFNAGASGAFSINGNFYMRSGADGVVRITNWAETDFGRLQFGGTTSSFPALKRSSTTLQVRLADDSAFAPFEASTLGTSAKGSVREDYTSSTQGNSTLTNRSVSYSCTATASDDFVTATGHIFSNGDQVTFTSLTGGAGLSTTTRYFVRDAETNRFKVATTVAGAAVNITSDATAGTVELVSAFVINPRNVGAFILGPKPDGTAAGGGNARGRYAVDLQMYRADTADAAAVASGNFSFLLGVNSRTSAERSSAFGTWNTTVSGFGAVALGCLDSNINGTYNVGIGQACAGNSRYGIVMFGHQFFGAQTIHAQLTQRTTTNTAVELSLEGVNNLSRLTIPSGRIHTYWIIITGVRSTGGTSAHYMRQYAIKNVGGTTSEVFAPVTIGTDTAAGTSIALSADDTNDSLKIECTGVASETWRWHAQVFCSEMAFGT